MVNYQNGKIYKLFSPSKNLVYYGSTTEPLSTRFAKHTYTFRNPDKYKGVRNSNKILECGDYKCELVLDYPCNNKQELELKEAEYIRNNECINLRIPTGIVGGTEYQKNYHRMYRAKKDAKD
jgi:hypothetical protein